MEGRSFPSIPFDEAVRALRRRGTNLFPSEHWASVWQEQHQAGFTVARSAGFDIVKDIHTALVDAMERGRTFDDFKRGLIPVLQEKGWWGDTTTVDPKTGERRTVRLGSVRRLETIFDTNMSVSFAEGRWEQQQVVKDAFPYLRYTGILDSRIRPAAPPLARDHPADRPSVVEDALPPERLEVPLRRHERVFGRHAAVWLEGERCPGRRGHGDVDQSGYRGCG